MYKEVLTAKESSGSAKWLKQNIYMFPALARKKLSNISYTTLQWKDVSDPRNLMIIYIPCNKSSCLKWTYSLPNDSAAVFHITYMNK